MSLIYSAAVPFLAVVIFYFVYTIPFFFLFLRRRSLEPINSRGWQLSLLSSLVGFFVFNILALEMFIDADGLEVSCHFLYWPTCTFIALFTTVRKLVFAQQVQLRN